MTDLCIEARLRITFRIAMSHADTPLIETAPRNFECPDCQHKALRHRKPNLRRNVTRRSTGNILHRWVCDDCEWTGDDEQVPADALKTVNSRKLYDYNSAIEW